MTCPRSRSPSVVKLGLALGNACFLIPTASRYMLGGQSRQVRGQAHKGAGRVRAGWCGRTHRRPNFGQSGLKSSASAA